MTHALLEPPASPFAGGCRTGPLGGGGHTLEERLEAAWRAVRAEGRAECPVCRSAMHLDRDDGDTARCTGCGSMLS
jgi:hypothetical protein